MLRRQCKNHEALEERISTALTIEYIFHTTENKNKKDHSCPFFLSNSRPQERNFLKYKKESSLDL